MNRHVERTLAHADRDARGCLVSRYSTGSHGYAQAWDGSTVVLAHRLVWEGEHDPIPDGMTVDHRDHCNRKCIEISHLRLITNYQNARRNRGDANPDLTVCLNGHDAPLVQRVRQRRGEARIWLTCIECERERQRRYRAGKAA
jgi:hypothetical protein